MNGAGVEDHPADFGHPGGERSVNGPLTAGGVEMGGLAVIGEDAEVSTVGESSNNDTGRAAGGSPTTTPAPPGSAARAAIDPDTGIDESVLLHIKALMAVSRHAVGGPDGGRGRKRGRETPGGSATCNDPEYMYTTVSTAVRAIYEDQGDWERSSPLTTRRKGWRPGRFDTFRLRAVERFALECGGGGLSIGGLEKLWDLLDTWDGTKPGMPIDDGHNDSLRDTFNSVNAFKDAIHDDVDDVVLGTGWLKCPLLVDGLRCVVFFRPVLEVILDMLKRGGDVRLWSGETGPAPPTNLRESPLDGDAFRLSEAALIEEKRDASCFVLGLHVYSDASQLSWSGGKLCFHFLREGWP